MKDTLLIILLLVIGYAIGYTRKDVRDYQIELTQTQVYLYDRDRLVDSISTQGNEQLITVLTRDNE